MGLLLLVITYIRAVSWPQLRMNWQTYMIVPSNVRSWPRSCSRVILENSLVLLVSNLIQPLSATGSKNTSSWFMNWHLVGLAISWFFEEVCDGIKVPPTALFSTRVDNDVFKIHNHTLADQGYENLVHECKKCRRGISHPEI